MKARNLIVLGALLSLLLILAGAVQASAPVDSASSTPQPGSKALAAWTPTPTPTRKPWPGFTFREVVSFFVPGAGGYACPQADRPGGAGPTVVYYQYRTGGELADYVCLFGFPTGQTTTVKIYRPDNRLAASFPVFIAEPDSPDDNLSAEISFGPLPNTAMRGRWRISAETEGVFAENSFNQPTPDISLTVTRSSKKSTSPFDPRLNPLVQKGDHLLLQGANFPPNQELPVAVYRDSGQENTSTHNFISGQIVQVNHKGVFEAGFGITKNFTPGYYFAVVVEDPDQETYVLDMSQFIYFRVIQPWKACSNAQLSLLHPEESAAVTAGQPSTVREKPGLSKRKLGVLNEFEQLHILAGPKCADGMVWWKVYSENTGLDGWTAEGKGGDYWIYPGW